MEGAWGLADGPGPWGSRVLKGCGFRVKQEELKPKSMVAMLNPTPTPLPHATMSFLSCTYNSKHALTRLGSRPLNAYLRTRDGSGGAYMNYDPHCTVGAGIGFRSIMPFYEVLTPTGEVLEA